MRGAFRYTRSEAERVMNGNGNPPGNEQQALPADATLMSEHVDQRP